MGAVVGRWRNRKEGPDDPGWSPRNTSIDVATTECGRVVASCRVEGASGAVFVQATPAWSAVPSLLDVFGIVGKMRVSLIADQVIGAGTTQAVTWNGTLGGIESLEVRVKNPPVAGTPPLVLAVCTWDAGSGYWDARFQALVDRLERIEVLLRHE